MSLLASVGRCREGKERGRSEHKDRCARQKSFNVVVDGVTASFGFDRLLARAASKQPLDFECELNNWVQIRK